MPINPSIRSRSSTTATPHLQLPLQIDNGILKNALPFAVHDNEFRLQQGRNKHIDLPKFALVDHDHGLDLLVGGIVSHRSTIMAFCHTKYI